MPGWYIHLEVAKQLAELLPRVNDPRADVRPLGGAPIHSFDPPGPLPADLAEIIRKFPNYYALGAIGPDIFFLLPDFRGRSGNFIAKLANWVIKFYDDLDAKVLGPWNKIMGPIEENQTEARSRLTGDLSTELGRISNYLSGIVTEAVLGFVSHLYDWFGLFKSGVGPGYDDQLFFWSDMFHYRRTNEFARDLFQQAKNNQYSDAGGQKFTSGSGSPFGYEEGIAFALGWMTHVGTDVTGHAFVNEKSGGPYRLHWQRHHLVENHMDAFVYQHVHGSDARYNKLAESALHFWLQFDPKQGNKPKYDLFNRSTFPSYPTGLSARQSFERHKAFDVDSTLPPALALFLLDTMKLTYGLDNDPAHNGGQPTHPIILQAVTRDEFGRPDQELMHTTYELLFQFIKYTTTDAYKVPKPKPPQWFPNIDPPLRPGSNDDAPSEGDSSWDSWNTLLAIFAWIRYLLQWLEYVATIIPALLLDVATMPAREQMYVVDEALYEIWKAFRYLLVMEGFIMPEPDEIDLGLIQLGTSSQGPYHGLLSLMNDVFGGLLGSDPNAPPPSEPVHDPLYPRQMVTDLPGKVEQFVGAITEVSADCYVPPLKDLRVPSEFLRPWEYPLANNAHVPINQELGPTRASPHEVGALPTDLLSNQPGSDSARVAYERAASPVETDALNSDQLSQRWNLGDPLSYSLHVMGQLTRDGLDSTDVQSFNLDSDRGYGYKCWDFNRHQLSAPTSIKRNPWKPPHWYVSEPAKTALGPFIFPTYDSSAVRDSGWVESPTGGGAYGPTLDAQRKLLMSPTTMAKALAVYNFDFRALWLDVITKRLSATHPTAGLPDLVDQWTVPVESIDTEHGFARATGIITRATHPNLYPWTISNDDVAFNHTTKPRSPGDDGADKEWATYTSFNPAVEADDEWKARRLAARTHLSDLPGTERSIGEGDWYYRDREFPIYLDAEHLHLLTGRPTTGSGAEPSGNLGDSQLRGCLGIEGESWQLDKQVMPWIGDRVFVAGRWIIDTGHSDKHTEIHSPYLVVRQFQVPKNAQLNTDRTGPTASSEIDAAIDVVVMVTGAWVRAPYSIEWDVYPPVRTDANANASVRQLPISPESFDGVTSAQYANAPDVRIESSLGGNHIHFRATVPNVGEPGPLRLGQEPIIDRRFIAAYRVSWNTEPGTVATRPALSYVGGGAKMTNAGGDIPVVGGADQFGRNLAKIAIAAKVASLGGTAFLGEWDGEVRSVTEQFSYGPFDPNSPKTVLPPELTPQQPPKVGECYVQAFSSGSEILWAPNIGAHRLPAPLAQVRRDFYSATKRIFCPTADAADDASTAFGVDAYGNRASLEIGIDGNIRRGYVAIYDNVADAQPLAQYDAQGKIIATGLAALTGKRYGAEYSLPCTIPQQFDRHDICGTHTPLDFPVEYDPNVPLAIHYVRRLNRDELFPGCSESTFDPEDLPPIA